MKIRVCYDSSIDDSKKMLAAEYVRLHGAKVRGEGPQETVTFCDAKAKLNLEDIKAALIFAGEFLNVLYILPGWIRKQAN